MFPIQDRGQRPSGHRESSVSLPLYQPYCVTLKGLEVPTPGGCFLGRGYYRAKSVERVVAQKDGQLSSSGVLQNMVQGHHPRALVNLKKF